MNNDGTMNETTDGRWSRARSRRAGVLAVTVGLALLTAACSSSSSSSHGPSTTGARGASLVSMELAFSRCVRAHGVPNFPDPNPNGQQPASSKQVLSGNPRSPAALKACIHLLPIGHGGQGPTFTAQQQQDYLKAAACMRSHGITNFPDPSFSGGNVNFPIPSSVDTSSQRFTHARQICSRLIPAGLPFSTGG